MNTFRALTLSSVAATLALPAAAQLEVTLDAVNDANAPGGLTLSQGAEIKY